MTLYNIALFLHIVGALIMGSAQVLEMIGVGRLRQAVKTSDLDAVFGFVKPLSQLYRLSGAMILLSGVYLSIVAWGAVAWIIVSLVVVTLLAVSGPLISGRKFKEIGQRATREQGGLSTGLRALTHAPILEWSHFLRMGAFLGIVLLMVAKPDLLGSLLTIVLSIVLAGALAMLRSRGVEAPQPLRTP